MKNIYIAFFALFQVASLSFAGAKAQPNDHPTALSGYDAVSYLAEMKAKKGDMDISVKWMNATWQFSSEANKKAFLENPEKYAPAYGGSCAHAVRNGKTEAANPACFVIEAERLFLLASTKQVEAFKKDLKANIEKADKNWLSLDYELKY
ncbi:MAG: YHS domain-containing (seleno)protein [Verrucomicrobiota bacterium]